MSKASDKLLDALHGALADHFRDVLENGREVIDKETGEVKRVPPDASTLNTIRQFLKDNHIQAGQNADPNLNALARMTLPFPAETDEYGLKQ